MRWIFMKLVDARQHYALISRAEFHRKKWDRKSGNLQAGINLCCQLKEVEL
jgi:hypothetical protein